MDIQGWSIFTNAFADGWALLASGTLDIWTIIWTSLKVSWTAVAIALLLGVPAGFYLGTRRSVSRSAALALANAGMGLPPTVVGLITSMLLSRRGPFGPLELLYSQPAMVIAQILISVPVVAAITATAVSSVPGELRLQARSLGASRWHEAILTLRESRMGLFAAVAAAFGAIISEVGAVQMVGGNLPGETQVMTTAIVQFTRMGRYGSAMALAVVLLAIIIFVNVLITNMQTSSDKHTREVK